MENQRIDIKAYMALIVVCIVWGTTYLAFKVGVKVFPSFLFGAIRQMSAGIILLSTILIIKKNIKWTWRDVRLQILPGIFMITMGNGIVGYALKFIPSGLAALLCSMMPLYIILINLLINRKDKLNAQIIIGLVLGFVGVLIVFRDNISFLGNKNYLFGIFIALISCFFWALGTIFSQRNKASTDIFFNASLQFIIGGTGLFFLSFLFDDWKNITQIPTSAIWALIYLIFIGSILGFICYLYALSKLPVGLVSVYAYINPLVAIMLGFILLNETITIYTALAFVVIVSGIYLVNTGYQIKKREREELINS